MGPEPPSSFMRSVAWAPGLDSPWYPGGGRFTYRVAWLTTLPPKCQGSSQRKPQLCMEDKVSVIP